jgi:hypothetical protein
MKLNIENEPTRAWIYRLSAAAVPLLTYYGIASEQEASLWVALFVALGGFGLAARNTSTS